MSKRRKRRKNQSQPRGVLVALNQIEIAKGHDGFLRGNPEPVLIAGLFRIGTSAHLVSRQIFRFPKIEKLPCVLYGTKDLHLKGPRERGGRHLLLVMAIEEDKEKDIQELYAVLERADEFVLWEKNECCSIPLHFSNVEAEGWKVSKIVDLILDGERLSKLNLESEIVGIRMLALENSKSSKEYRLHFVGEDQRNDWTATFFIRS